MGLDSRKVRASAVKTTMAMSRMSPQELPEKLPMDQLWRLTISASSAKVTTKSVMAEQM